IRLSGELPEAELLVRCAPFELEQAVAELIANALKYGRSRVSVTVGLDAGWHGSAAQFPGVQSPEMQSPAAQSPEAQSPAAQSPAAQFPEVQSPAALIRVSDDGEGLTEAELRSVGQRFWRSHRHRSVIGHGLGLSMVERLLSEQGGSLGLSNRDRGGLDAVIRLPLADGDPA
ncbi:sensor histidine kinase, partial [Leucobacter sp. M11]|uniref:sensor histidine kinase n=1 Tax=Leucobacter sp. M11 TaxID=2993565 RepID=UPI002D7F032C